tara:strand:- start:468 stop:1349 length:882 start_codon:yes stop_codon:yes gene_type:complete
LDGDKFIVQSVDFFTPIVDDPYQFGQIAAANALSDIYAMGAKPLFALNIVGFPIDELSKDILSAILKGGSDKAEEAGIPIVGGHSIDDKEPKYGLVVSGEVQKSKLIKNSEAKEGDILVLTKPLGSGIISTAIKNGEASEEMINEAINCMKTLNSFAGELMHEFSVNASTDITGFGLLGHLYELCKASKVSAKIKFDSIPFLNGISTLASNGNISGGTKRNLEYISDFVDFSKQLNNTEKLMLSDAQTSGGLLVALPKSKATEYAKQCTEATGFESKQIGILSSYRDKYIIVD